jgi:hypothetical protein
MPLLLLTAFLLTRWQYRVGSGLLTGPDDGLSEGRASGAPLQCMLISYVWYGRCRRLLPWQHLCAAGDVYSYAQCLVSVPSCSAYDATNRGGGGQLQSYGGLCRKVSMQVFLTSARGCLSSHLLGLRKDCQRLCMLRRQHPWYWRACTMCTA